MGDKGLTLLELVVVLAVAGFLLTIGTLNFRQMNEKAAVETQAKTLYADLAEVRLDSLYTKRGRSVVVSGNRFEVYSTNTVTVGPVSSKTLRFPLKWNDSESSRTISFDSAGLMEGEVPLCVDSAGGLGVTSAAVDSVILSAARIKLGKRQGGVCVANGIDTQ